MLVREFCAENMELVPAAVAAGAARVELCDNLAVGGTTPSYGVIRAAVAHARETGTDVMCMVRPRGGSFEYTPAEAQMMRDDLVMAKSLGVTGVVFGCLPPEDQLPAIDWLADQGVERILTHGGAAGTPIAGTLGRLRAYIERAAGRIVILPGGGITWENAEDVAAELGVSEVHGTKIVRIGEKDVR